MSSKYIIRKNQCKNIKIHVITLCTKNYDKIGCYGANALKKYCDDNGYLFTLYREKMIPELHINFTKNWITIDAINKTSADYVVLIDSDIEIVNPYIKIENIFNINPFTIFYAPKDFYDNQYESNNKINGGFMIWKKCKRSIELNEMWIHFAKNQCKGLIGPPQQTVYDNCLSKIIYPYELEYLDHNLVGMTYSKFIRQTKDTKLGWEKMNSPRLLICKLGLMDNE